MHFFLISTQRSVKIKALFLQFQTKRIFEQSRDFRRILKEKDEKIKVLMDLNFTLQLENRELKQQLEGNTSIQSSDTSNILELQEADVPQYVRVSII